MDRICHSLFRIPWHLEHSLSHGINWDKNTVYMNVKAKMGKFTMKNYNHYDRHKLRNILRYIQGLVFLIIDLWFMMFFMPLSKQYFSYITAVSFIGGGNHRVPGENHRYVALHCQVLSHNVLSVTSRLNGIRIYNFIGTDCKLKVVVNPTTIRSRWRRSVQALC